MWNLRFCQYYWSPLRNICTNRSKKLADLSNIKHINLNNINLNNVGLASESVRSHANTLQFENSLPIDIRFSLPMPKSDTLTISDDVSESNKSSTSYNQSESEKSSNELCFKFQLDHPVMM